MPTKKKAEPTEKVITNDESLKKLRFDAVRAVMEFGSNQDRGRPLPKAQEIVDYVLTGK